MKTEWTCTWQLIPGGEEQTKTFPTYDAARKAMAKVLTDAVDLRKYTDALRKEAGEDCASSADFLDRFLSDLFIPEGEADVPAHLQIPDNCLLEIDPYEGFRWKYMHGECPMLTVSHVLYADGSEPVVIDFGFDNPEAIVPGRVNAVYIKIRAHMNYGTSAYPLMILKVLTEEPQTQEAITREVNRRYGTGMDRKAAGRHLKLLQALGFPVAQSARGYFLREE